MIDLTQWLIIYVIGIVLFSVSLIENTKRHENLRMTSFVIGLFILASTPLEIFKELGFIDDLSLMLSFANFALLTIFGIASAFIWPKKMPEQT